jgi:hypothetical protein
MWDRPDDGGSTYLWNIGRQLFYTAVYPRRHLNFQAMPASISGAFIYYLFVVYFTTLFQ